MGLKCYADMKDASLYELLIQDIIETENQLMVFSDYRCQYCPDTGRSIGAYITFYQGGPIYHATHVPATVSQSRAETE